MVIIILQNMKPSIRGELSRWLIEPRAGVFIGNISAMVRDKLWEKIVKSSPKGGGILIHSAQNEQGFKVLSFGDISRNMVNHEGLTLVCIPKSI
jgi:CRISPR-associated protein Cas2